jgi:Flp pilus assembly protein TadD/ribosomal protein L40E
MKPAARRRLLLLVALALVVAAAAVILWLPPPGQGTATGPAPLAYVGVRSCEGCHAEEARRWRGSHHDLAMQEAKGKAVLGNFDDARFTYEGVTSRFYRKDGKPFVRTDGPDGRLADYPVAYVFGLTPLQQYLVELPAGRFQALSLAWDSRPEKEGGQRWFHLYPGEHVDHRDVLHWTKPSQNWNTQCAECHSTNLRKGYRLDEDRFRTTFSELNVACEACHGPGSRHAEWAEAARARGQPPRGEPGLIVRFTERRSRTWEMDRARGIARPTKFLETRFEVETCARCHARRGVLTEDYRPGRLLAETHRPALLDEGLYYADGQMRDEVYNWGSFLQSRMYAAGVTCSDCHDAHDLKVKVGKDDVCSSCHQPERFATRKHHFHRESGQGASCVACHLRTETYMVVDVRHDHSFRVPRPDLTVALGRENAPNACNDCHRDRSPQWAARAVRRWYPGGQQEKPHYALALHAGRTYQPAAEPVLLEVIGNPKTPGIVRGTAVSLLPPHLGPDSLPALEKAATDPDPLVRLGAASTLETLPPKERVRIGVHLLWDPVRAVRVEAVPAFADVPDAELATEARAAFDRSLDDYVLAQRSNAERPEAHVNLGIVNVKRGRLEEARRDYDAALRLAPWFLPAYVNLADLLRLQGREDEGEKVLRQALRVDADNASVHHALGLLLVRTKRAGEALAELRLAAELAPGTPDFAYAYAIGLHSAGRAAEALAVLRTAQERNPGARSLLVALVTIHRERGALGEARAWARKLVEAAPGDPSAVALATSLEPAAEGGER